MRTHGNGCGIDARQGKWPNLHMSWQPIWITNCIDRAPRQAKDEGQFCVECFPVHAITYGEAAEEQRDELRNKGFEVFDLSAHEKGKPNVTYAKKDTLAR